MIIKFGRKRTLLSSRLGVKASFGFFRITLRGKPTGVNSWCPGVVSSRKIHKGLLERSMMLDGGAGASLVACVSLVRPWALGDCII